MTPDNNTLNVFNEPLVSCGENPITRFFRDRSCNTCKEDVGSHTVCIKATTKFLSFSKSIGNDLSTPLPEFGFPGLKDGDTRCLCVARCLEAHEKDSASRVHLTRTHKRALEVVPLETLKIYAADLN